MPLRILDRSLLTCVNGGSTDYLTRFKLTTAPTLSVAQVGLGVATF